MNAQKHFVVMFHNDGDEYENYGVFHSLEEAEAFIQKICEESNCYELDAFDINAF